MLLEALHVHDFDMDRKLSWLETRGMYVRCRDDVTLPRGIFLLVEFVRAMLLGGHKPDACKGTATIGTVHAARVLKDSFGGTVVNDVLGPPEMWNGGTKHKPAGPITFCEFCDRDRLLVTGQARLRGVMRSSPRNLLEHVKGRPDYKPMMDRFKILSRPNQVEAAPAQSTSVPLLKRASTPKQSEPSGWALKRPGRQVYAQGDRKSVV